MPLTGIGKYVISNVYHYFCNINSNGHIFFEHLQNKSGIVKRKEI